MIYTLEELCELLKERVDPELLIEELGLSSEDIVNRFEDLIEIRFNRLVKLIED
jgi:hypothetical protein